VLLAALGRAVQVEVAWETSLRQAAARPAEKETPLWAPRGRILDRRGVVLADHRTIRVITVQYPWLNHPPDESWVLATARARLSKADRNDAAKLDAAKAGVLFDRSEQARRLAELNGWTFDEWIGRAYLVRMRVGNIAENVNFLARQQAARSRVSEGSWLARLVRRLTSSTDAGRLVVPEELDYHMISGDVSNAIVEEIENHPEHYPGVQILARPARCYPHGATAAHVLGCLGLVTPRELAERHRGEAIYWHDDWVGRMGVEHQYETRLRGQHGAAVRRVEPDGRLSSSRIRREPIPGRDIRLTLDFELQRSTDAMLDNWMKRRNAKTPSLPATASGAVVVMDVRNGAVRAASSAPSFDPSVFVAGNPSEIIAFQADENRPLLDRSYRLAVPPGSLFEVVAAAALLESGTIDEGKEFDCPGYWIRPELQQCPSYARQGVGHGPLTLSDALAQNCNVFFFEHAVPMGPRPLVDWAARFGIGRPTGVDLPAEEPGCLPTPETIGQLEHHVWKVADSQALSVGQGSLTATPMQMVRLFAAVANGGRLLRPRVVEEVLGAEGAQPEGAGTGERKPAENPRETMNAGSIPPPVDLGLSPRTLQVLREGLRRAVADPKGAAHAAALPETVAFAGKAGTAETGPDRARHAWFAGYAPADDPKLAFVILLEHAADAEEITGPPARQLVLRMKELGML